VDGFAELEAVAPPDARTAVGDRVRLSVDASRVAVLARQ
jgi:hypothetical protein